MQEIATLTISFAAVFTAGVLCAKMFFAGKFSINKKNLDPVENAKVRMKTSSAFYRCRLISFDNEEWVFSAPMQRDMFVPIPVGEVVTCEVIGQSGLLTFQSKVIARRSENPSIVIEAPKNISLDERREELRNEDIRMDVTVAGKTGTVMDLSPGGARVRIRGFEREGNLVRIDLPTGESRGATVIDSKNDHEGSVIRLRFDEPIDVGQE